MKSLKGEKVLLSPTGETDAGLIARNFFATSVGFGTVHELHENDERLGNVAVSFSDLEDGPRSVVLAYNAELIKDEKHVIDLIAFSVGFYRDKQVAPATTGPNGPIPF
jgi:hypothetical protein